MTDLIATTRAILQRFYRGEFSRMRSSEIPLHETVRYYRHGFLTRSMELYDFDHYSPSQYVSDIQLYRTGKINGENRNLLDNKLLFHSLLSNKYQCYLPTLLGQMDAGNLRGTIVSEPVIDTVEELENDYLRQGIICKPIAGSYGKGVFSAKRTDDDVVIDGKDGSMAEFRRHLTDMDGYLLQERLGQDSYASDIFPNSVNTIRLLTMVDPNTGKPFVAAAAHRFGTSDSVPVDNMHRGGLGVEIDISSGRLSPAVKKEINEPPIKYPEHPDTGSQIAGIPIPNWESISQTILTIAEDLGVVVPYIGWDVAVMDRSGTLKIIEANARSDVDLLQLNGPLLENPRIRQFYRYHGIL